MTNTLRNRAALLFPVAILASAAYLGCGAANADKPQDPNPNDDSHKGNVAEVTEGAPDYVANCAKCHGPTGKGTDDGPPLVGDNALPKSPPPTAKVRTMDFVTAADVFDFMKAHMPKDKPGSLSDNQYYAILAFDLKLNGLDLHGQKVDPTTASTIHLPGR